MPPTTSCARTSLLTNVTRCPTAIVISSGDMPEAVMVIVGGPAGAGAGGAGATVGGGVGDVGVGDDESLEHAASDVSERKIRKRSGIIFDAGGATGQVEPIT